MDYNSVVRYVDFIPIYMYKLYMLFILDLIKYFVNLGIALGPDQDPEVVMNSGLKHLLHCCQCQHSKIKNDEQADFRLLQAQKRLR